MGGEAPQVKPRKVFARQLTLMCQYSDYRNMGQSADRLRRGGGLSGAAGAYGGLQRRGI